MHPNQGKKYVLKNIGQLWLHPHVAKYILHSNLDTYPTYMELHMQKLWSTQVIITTAIEICMSKFCVMK